MLKSGKKMNRNEIINEIINCKPTPGRNIMGASESWYNPYYAIQQTFTEEEINNMSEEELNHLINLAEVLGEAFY